MTQKRIIVGISGASGVTYGIRLLEILRPTDIETHLIMSNSAEITLAYESNLKISDVKNLADVAHNVKDIAACLSSGSYRTLGMVIAPCSVRTMSEISSGVTSSLLTRSADVILKERRKLVLMVRETPLHTGHLRTMVNLSELGAIIAPPVPAFYAKPNNLDEMVDYSLGRILDLFDIEIQGMNRWDENSKKRPEN
ncbi:UbiX family flavin prenyltransferase [uncultured Kiloniella sp.]|uniref:UbiX family flavin prenyltransferase n=1 Tax=uncultured Kiloniella sp. TaxID=1133091 RepID=UPI002635CA03|nr:UbiX family flavin prenyltransferase [uncultured Kiloniella sp.]